jgi:hypothetical protein
MPGPVTFEVGINPLWPGEKLPKGDDRWGDFNGAFRTERHTPESLFHEVAKKGYAFSAALKGYRKVENFVSAQHLALDVDSGSPALEALLVDDFISRYASFVYSTPSYTPEAPRWRVVFTLPEPLTDPDIYRKGQTALLAHYGNTDQSIKDPARLLFGSNPQNGVSRYLGNILPMVEVLKLVSEYDDRRREMERSINHRRQVPIDPARLTGETPDARYISRATQEEIAWLASRAKGTGERHNGLLVVAARMESLRLSEWLAPQARDGIDPYAVALEAAQANGYLAEYGQEDTRRAIAWGINVAEPRPMPPGWGEAHRNGYSGNRGQPEWTPPETQPPVNHLRFRSAAEIARETPDSVPWIADPWVALGSLTELDGKIKAGGKTTWLLALCRKVLDGQPFMGKPTLKTPVVFLTEQPMSSFREALRRADLLEREDFRVLRYHDTIGTPWPQVVEAAKQECLRMGAKLLGVDTFPQFAGIRGDSENSSGATLEALEPIQGVVALGIGVMGVRHDRKAGGDVGDSGRGSSAWGGVADTIISIRRGDGNASPTVRILQSLSRFDGPPDKLVIDLRDGEYVALGTETKVAEQQAREEILKAAPTSEDHAKSTDELIKEAEVKTTIGKETIKLLHTEGRLVRIGKGVSRNPYKYWVPDVCQSEPPVVATDRHTDSTDAGQDDGSKVGRSVYKDAVATDRHSSGAVVTGRGQGTSAVDSDDTSKSRSVGTPTLNSDRPTSEDSSNDVLVVE